MTSLRVLVRDESRGMMSGEKKYDVFLSYNTLDRAYVECVAKELQARQCSSFVDQWYLTPGHDWIDALERALQASRAAAVFLGPHEMGRWQQRERAWALDRSVEDGNFRFIPVLLPGCEPPLGFLKQLTWIDLRDDPTSAALLDALAAAIRGERVDLDGRPKPRAMICPYRGLLAFREEDSEFFCGRQKYTDDLVGLVKQHSMLAVTGASGSGKSSVVRAGLVPRLRRRDEGAVWDILTMFPKENPLHSLADVFLPLVEPELSGIDLIRKRKTLAEDLEQARVPLWDLAIEGLRQQQGTDRLLLVVDQWEELYTNGKNETQRNRFIRELLDATSRNGSPLSVVFTVRWDFYDEILKNRPLLDRLRHSRLDLGPMNRDELRSAIEEPGNKVGLTFQDGLVNRILDDAGDEPGKLPLLEFVLKELWNSRRGDGRLTHNAYEALGLLTGAIATRAETVFGQLSTEEKSAAEALFRRLVKAGATTEEDTRRRADLNGLDATTQRVARKLADERLLVTTRAEAETHPAATAPANEKHDTAPRETAEVAHEELLRQWDRLKQWVDADRQFLQWRSRLVPLLGQYARDPKSALLRGDAQRESRSYVPSRAAELEESERRFVVASQQADRRKKMTTGITAVVLLCAALFVAYLNHQRNRRQQAHNLVESLLNPTSGAVEPYLQQLEQYRDLATKELRTEFTSDARDPIQHVHAAFGLIRFGKGDSKVFEFLLDNISWLPKDEGANLITALSVLKENDLQQLELDLRQRIEKSSGDEEQKSRYLATALELGVIEIVTPVCNLQSDVYDAAHRTTFIHGFRDFPGDLERVADLLAAKDLDPDLRSALCVAVGRLGEEAAEPTGDVLERLFVEAADGGTHSAARWALLQQGITEEQLDELLRPRPHSDERDWYVGTFQKITMVKIPAARFALGDATDKENPTPEDQPVPFPAIWLSDREISVGQFEALMPELKGESERDVAAERTRLLKPAGRMTWFDAVLFCNRLSATEGLQPYYQLEENKARKDEDGHIIAIDAEVSIIDPDRHGYRLPTETEWEYSCRAMSASDYCFGDSEELLPEYTVFAKTSIDVCGRRIPNAWGLFDVHGNVYEWCWDKFDSDSRVLRGGSFDFNYPLNMRSAMRDWFTPDFRGLNYGFRVSRTP